MPRLYREAPLASIWEGSGNVQCLDVIRAMIRNPECVEAFAMRWAKGRCSSPGWTGSRRGFATTCAPIPPPSRRGPALWSSGWRSPSRARCWSASATRRWPMRSAPRASRARGPGVRHAAGRHRLHADHRPASSRGLRRRAAPGRRGNGLRDPALRARWGEEYVLVITGEGDAFCAGWDLQDAAELGGHSTRLGRSREPALDVRPKGLARDRCSRLQGAPWSGRITACSRASDGARLTAMCRNIRQLHNFDPPATEEEVQERGASYVRKISGSNKPSKANTEAFNRAVDEVAASTREAPRLARHERAAEGPRGRGGEAAGEVRSALRGVTRQVSEPVELADHLGEADRVGERVVVDVLRVSVGQW